MNCEDDVDPVDELGVRTHEPSSRESGCSENVRMEPMQRIRRTPIKARCLEDIVVTIADQLQSLEREGRGGDE